MKYSGLSLAAAALLVSASVSLGAENRTFRFCNGDTNNGLNIAVASYDSAWGTTGVSGWWNVDAGTCQNFYEYTSDSYTHYFFLMSRGEALDLSPRQYEIMGLTFTGGIRKSSERFCIDLESGFDISQTIFDPNRATSCQGNEKLVPFQFESDGGYETSEFKIPAFSSSGGSSSSSSSSKSFTLLDALRSLWN